MCGGAWRGGPASRRAGVRVFTCVKTRWCACVFTCVETHCCACVFLHLREDAGEEPEEADEGRDGADGRQDQGVEQQHAAPPVLPTRPPVHRTPRLPCPRHVAPVTWPRSRGPRHVPPSRGLGHVVSVTWPSAYVLFLASRAAAQAGLRRRRQRGAGAGARAAGGLAQGRGPQAVRRGSPRDWLVGGHVTGWWRGRVTGLGVVAGES